MRTPPYPRYVPLFLGGGVNETKLGVVAHTCHPAPKFDTVSSGEMYRTCVY